MRKFLHSKENQELSTNVLIATSDILMWIWCRS